jgi:hypothetical protein
VADLRFDLHGTDEGKTLRIRDLLTGMYRIDRMVGRETKALELFAFEALSCLSL